jgi:hypothetical protein
MEAQEIQEQQTKTAVKIDPKVIEKAKKDKEKAVKTGKIVTK